MLGSLLALVHAHRQCLTIDKEAIAAYDTKLKEERKRADDQVSFATRRYTTSDNNIYDYHTFLEQHFNKVFSI